MKNIKKIWNVHNEQGAFLSSYLSTTSNGVKRQFLKEWSWAKGIVISSQDGRGIETRDPNKTSRVIY